MGDVVARVVVRVPLVKCAILWPLVVLAFPSNSLLAEAAEASSLEEAPAIVPDGRDRVYFVGEGFRASGMYGSRSFPVYVPENWLIHDTGGRLVLDLEASALLTNANLTAVLNGVVLGTSPLERRHGSTTLTLDIPSRAVVSGWNILELRFYLRASDDPCQDVDNPGLWVRVGGESFLELPHDREAAVPDLSGFPGSYAYCDGDSDNDDTALITFLLPPKLSSVELSIVAVLAERFGAARLCAAGKVRALFLDESPRDLRGTHLVVVGDLGQIEAAKNLSLPIGRLTERLSSLRAAHVSQKRFGALVEDVNPRDPYRRLLFAVGSDADGMALLLHNLRSGEAMDGLEGSAALFLDRANRRPGDQHDPASFTLADLKLDDIVLRGVTSRTFSFTIPVPRHWRLDSDAHLHLKLRHPVSFKRSASLEVTMGGIPVWTREFVPDLGTLETRELEVDVPIPPTSSGSGAIRVGLNLYIDVGTDDCARPYDDSLWVVVLRDSVVSLSHEPVEDWDLRAWPDLFVRGTRLEHLGFVLDRASGAAGVCALATAATSLGARSGRSNDIDLDALWSEDFGRLPAGKKQERGWIVVNTGSVEPALSALVPRLPLPLDKAGRVAREGRIRYAIPETVDHAALWEVFPSPWRVTEPILLMEVLDPEALKLAPVGEVWGDQRVHGNVALFFPPSIDGGGHGQGQVLAMNVLTREPGQTPVPAHPRQDSRWIWLLVSCVGLGLAITVIRKTWPRRKT